MKNIHLIPTDKPSRLFLNKVNNKLLLDSDTYCDLIRILPSSNYQNIYITNSEEIKEGDWCYDKVLNLIFQTDNHTDFKYANQTDNVLKIILTTDQDLIKDGVQPIDDEFLEWFVRNTSCEEVEVERLEDGQYVDYLEDNSVIEGIYENYKIIIPQEEPKQETELEEAAERYAHNYFNMHETNNYKALKQGYEAGAKEMAERMYSEAIKFGKWLDENIQQREYYPMSTMTMEELFKQFKKK
jgi:hypothetical protein